MKAICFLGAATAYDTTYVMPDGREHTAPYFPAALVRFYPVETLYVFVTEGARNLHYDRLALQAEDFVEHIYPVPIPDGRNETELWRIFQAVADVVDADDHLIFDITHGFRSLPFLSFLAAAYLREVKSVELEAVLYGAYEAGDRSVTPARAPVFDLTRFVTLLDWVAAAESFTRFGDASDLARLLRDPHATPVHLAAAAGDRAAQQIAGLLRGAATAVDDVATALRLVRPADVMTGAAALETALDGAAQVLKDEAQPFVLVGDQVRRAYGPFGLSAERQMTEPATALQVERRLVAWYVEHEQYGQAITLAREHVVSHVIQCLGWDPAADRRLAEDLLNAETHLRSSKRSLPLDAPCRERLAGAFTLWSRLGDLRNDLAHVGKGRRSPRSPSAIIKAACSLAAEMSALEPTA
jgi:CRISPR-associated DxTHG motif protein